MSALFVCRDRRTHCATIGTIVLAFPIGDAWADTLGKIQPDPVALCSDLHVKAHELCFDKPTDGIARAEYLSETFYAIILKSTERCTITEEERIQVQREFANAKVFSTRFECDDGGEENITYTSVNERVGFLALYAGRTRQEARAKLAEVTSAGRYPGANLRKMQAKLVYP